MSASNSRPRLRVCRRPRAAAVQFSRWLVAGLIAVIQPLTAHQPHDPMSVVAVSPNYAQDQTVFLGTSALTMPLPISEYVPMVSTNAGFTFSVMPGLPNLPMLSVGISPAYSTDGTVFMAGQGGLWRSVNRGASWIAVGGSPLASTVPAVAITPNFATGNSVFAITTNGVFGSSDRGTTWLQLTTPSPLSSNLTALSISPNYAVDATLLTGSASNGIFRSNNFGHTWTQVTPSLTQSVAGIAFSPAYSADKTIFAVTNGGGVYVSTDNGTTWTASNTGITDLNGTAITVSPNFATDSTLWVTTAAAGVFRSTNRGSSWTAAGKVPRPLSNQTPVHYVTISAGATSTGTVLFLGMFEGLFTSTNGGASWTYCDTVPTRLVRDLKLSPEYPADQTVFVSTYGSGALWSRDGGQTWCFMNTGLENSYTDAIEMSPNFDADGMAFVGTTLGLQRISGVNPTCQPVWLLMTMLGKPTFPRSLSISPGFAKDATIFIGTHDGISYPPTVTFNGKTYSNQGLFVSVDGGQNWEPTGVNGPPVDTIAVSPDYPNDKTVFAGSATKGLFRSTDAGVTFTSISPVTTDLATLPVAVSPAYAADQTVFVSTSHSGIYKSTNGGTTWTVLPGTGSITAFSIALSPNYGSDQTMFVGTLQQGLLKSTDGGSTFTQTTLPGNYATAVAISPGFVTDHTLFAASYQGLYKSTDAGATWVYTKEPSRQEEQRQFPPGPFNTIVYKGSWPLTHDSASNPQSSTVQYASTTQSGATASLTFMGSGADWIGYKGPTGGTAQVLVDGVLDATVNLNAAQLQPQQTLWSKQGLPCAVHTVTIRAMPGTGQSVTLDALDISQATCY